MNKERPILFSAPMVRAILDGRKSQTRRVLKPQPVPNPHNVGKHWVSNAGVRSMIEVEDFLQGPDTSVPGCFCPYGQPSDRLWVRETWAIHDQGFDGPGESDFPIYRADTDGPEPKRWRPSIYMPRHYSRITLEVTDVRVERLQVISETDAKAEGAPLSWASGQYRGGTWRQGFADLWSSINGADSWAANPWVWVVGIKQVEAGVRRDPCPD